MVCSVALSDATQLRSDAYVTLFKKREVVYTNLSVACSDWVIFRT